MTPDPSELPVLALDLGGTQVRTALVTPGGRLLGRLAQPTSRVPADVLVALCAEQLRASMAAAEPGDITPGGGLPSALTISAPGPLDPFAGTFIDPPNLDPSLRGFPFAERLGAAHGLPALMERDTQVAALAEGRFGAARGLTDYVYLTVSTGIGGGVVSDGRLLRGIDGLASELGHLAIDLDGPPCGCGARGHLEGIASGSGIARQARDAGLGELSAREVARVAEQGNATAAGIMDYARRAFAAALVTIVDVFNPQRVIVGGGLALGQGERLLGPAREAVARYAFRRQAERVEIVPAQLGDDVGLVGGLALVAFASLGDDGILHNDATTAGRSALSTPSPSTDDGPDAIKQSPATHA